MAKRRSEAERLHTEAGFTVLASGKPLMVSEDLHECLRTLREYPKAELYRNADQQLLAYTTGMGPGRGRRIDE